MTEFFRRQRYQPRSIGFRGVVEHAGWRLKSYDVAFSAGTPFCPGFEEGVARALAMLPQPAVTNDSPGLGVLIRHAGCGSNYVVAGGWTNQNELLLFVVASAAESPERWEYDPRRFSVCVWDLQIVWHEREAYVRHVLSPVDGPNPSRYLKDAAPATE